MKNMYSILTAVTLALSILSIGPVAWAEYRIEKDYTIYSGEETSGIVTRILDDIQQGKGKWVAGAAGASIFQNLLYKRFYIYEVWVSSLKDGSGGAIVFLTLKDNCSFTFSNNSNVSNSCPRPQIAIFNRQKDWNYLIKTN